MNKILLTTIMLFCFLFFSCQKEKSEFIDENPNETIVANSVLAKLLIKTSKNNGSIDDFIDGTPCTSIQFPYQVKVNGQIISITNETNLLALNTITTPILIQFPITVIFEDYSTTLISNQQELNALIQMCNQLEQAIECIDIIYPITFFTFNSNNEQTGTVVTNNDAEMVVFLMSLNSSQILALNYPISLQLANGLFSNALNNSQLRDLIEGCTPQTEEEPDPISFESILTSGNWFIDFFFDDEDQTAAFSGYEFTFNTGGNATASNGSNTVPGTWSITNSSSGQLKLILDFGDDDPFDELEDDWKVIAFDNQLIRLFDGSDDYLTFSRNPNSGGSGQAQQLRDVLTDGLWYVALFLEDGEEDETSNFNSFSFDFLTNGQVLALNSTTTLTGTWNVSGSDNALKLILNFNDVYPLDELDDDWDVDEFNSIIVKLRDDDDPDADILIFEKL